jgi:hypothetical protein
MMPVYIILWEKGTMLFPRLRAGKEARSGKKKAEFSRDATKNQNQLSTKFTKGHEEKPF